MMGRLHADLFFQERFMLNEVGVKIKLIRSRDAFCLMGAASKVRIIHASMFVRKVKLMPSVFLAYAKTLENGTAKYPIRRVVFAVPQNYLDVTHEKLFSGQLPTRIVVGLVNNQAFSADTLPEKPRLLVCNTMLPTFGSVTVLLRIPDLTTYWYTDLYVVANDVVYNVCCIMCVVYNE